MFSRWQVGITDGMAVESGTPRHDGQIFPMELKTVLYYKRNSITASNRQDRINFYKRKKSAGSFFSVLSFFMKSLLKYIVFFSL